MVSSESTLAMRTTALSRRARDTMSRLRLRDTVEWVRVGEVTGRHAHLEFTGIEELKGFWSNSIRSVGRRAGRCLMRCFPMHVRVNKSGAWLMAQMQRFVGLDRPSVMRIRD
jgi:hypothetical protein